MTTAIEKLVKALRDEAVLAGASSLEVVHYTDDALLRRAADALEAAMKVMDSVGRLSPPDNWKDDESIHVFNSGWITTGTIRAARDWMKGLFP